MEAQGARDLPPAIQYKTVCPLRYIASGPQFMLEGGNEGSRARLSPNCHNILEFHVGMLAS